MKCLQFVHSEVQEFLGAYGITFISKEESAMLWRNADGAFFSTVEPHQYIKLLHLFM